MTYRGGVMQRKKMGNTGNIQQMKAKEANGDFS